MNIINYMEPSYDEYEKNAVVEYLQSDGWLTEFRKTREFEESIRTYVGAKYCSVMMNGTVTLIAALLACGVKAGDEVIVPDFTMAATPHAAAILGAKPVFADVERETLCLDFERMKEAVTEKTKAVIIVDLNGRYSSRFSDILKYCKDRKMPIIEDAAQALGSTWQGKPLGTFGDIGSFSFSMPKIITTGQGGAVVTNDENLYQKMLQIRDFGREKAGSDHYLRIGANFKFTDLQAVIGIEQMKKLTERVIRKKKMYEQYTACLENVSQVTVYPTNVQETAPCFIELQCENKKGLMNYLKGRGIMIRPFYPPLHSEPAYGIDGVDFPVTEEISAKGLWLPSSMKVTDGEIEYICSCIREFYEEKVNDR